MKTRIVFCVVVLVVLSGARRRAVEITPPDPELRIERSFAVTEKSILAGFPLDRVFGAILSRSVAPSTTPERFFQQIFDTQNRRPGLDASMPHCDDFLLDGKPAHNGYLRPCPTPEGPLAKQPFIADHFFPMAIVNRFDMAPADGATCGQYRIIFSRHTDPNHFVNIIFEGALANPRPDLGLAACRPVAQFWADLSAVDSVPERRARLESFFYDGIDGFPPVLHPDHFRDAPNGIRNMHWIRGFAPRFYQFRIVNGCSNGTCRVFAMPDLLENFPSGSLLDMNDTSPRATRYREFFLTQIPTLAVRDPNRFSLRTPDEFLMLDRDAPDRKRHFPLLSGFAPGAMTSAAAAYRARVEQALRENGSTMTFIDAIQRASQLTCEGCHTPPAALAIGDGVEFPAANADFQHLSRAISEPGDEGRSSRFSISSAMRTVFIPNRMRILIEFLKSGKAPDGSQ